MSMPGWYPDPGGAQGQFRYWDGSQWSAQTTPNPTSGPPSPGGPGGGPGGQQRKSPLGWIIGGVAAVLVLALAAWFLIPMLLGGNKKDDDTTASSATPTISAWNETASPTPSSPPPSASPSQTESSGGTTVNCPVGSPNSRQSSSQSGKLVGGGLVVDQVPGWKVDVVGISYAYDVDSQTDQVTPGWMSMIAVGALAVKDGFGTPKQSAEMAMQCMASSGFYDGFSKRTDTWSKEISVSGKKAWHLRSNIYVTGKEPIEGDTIDVIVVDTGNSESLGFYMTAVTIGDSARQGLVDKATASLKVG